MSGPEPKKLYVLDPKPYYSAYEISKVKNQYQGRGHQYQYQNQYQNRNRYKPRKYLTRVRPGGTSEILNAPQENHPDNVDPYPADPVLNEDNSYEENDLSLINPPEKLVQFNDYPYLSTIETITSTNATSSEKIHSAGAFLSSLGLALILVILLLPLGVLIYYVFYRKEGDSAAGGDEKHQRMKKFKDKLRKGRKEKEYQRLREKVPGFYFDTSEESLLLNAEKAYEKCIENKKNKQLIKNQKLPDLHRKPPANHPCFPDQPNTIVQIKCDECVFSVDETLQSEIDKSNQVKDKCKKKNHRKSSQDLFKECKKGSNPPRRSRSKRKTRSGSRFVTTTIPISCTSNGETNAEDQEIFARYDSSRPVVDYSKVNKYHISDTDDCDNDDRYTRTRDGWNDRRNKQIIQKPRK